jgi:hypothetical protein
MSAIGRVGRGVARIAFRRGSPQRIPYSSRLTVATLLVLLALAILVQVYVFANDLVGVSLYLFSLFAGLYLGTALLSRRVPAARLRPTVQATLLLLAAAHLILLLAALLTAPFAAALPWMAWLIAAALVGIVILGMTNCVQFALARSRAAAAGVTLAFVFAVAAFYATMARLVAIAMA